MKCRSAAQVPQEKLQGAQLILSFLGNMLPAKTVEIYDMNGLDSVILAELKKSSFASFLM